MAEEKSPQNPAGSIWHRARGWLRGLAGKSTAEHSGERAAEDIINSNPCCSPQVHIAYRGKSDDRMYMAYNRTWQEVRYFQQEGLRVFCALCRRRLL